LKDPAQALPVDLTGDFYPPDPLMNLQFPISGASPAVCLALATMTIIRPLRKFENSLRIRCTD